MLLEKMLNIRWVGNKPVFISAHGDLGSSHKYKNMEPQMFKSNGSVKIDNILIETKEIHILTLIGCNILS